MKPGDVVTCGLCGAQARATWTSLAKAWQSPWPLLLSWTHGPHPRHEATHVAPALCLWCFERRQALGPGAEPLYRPTGALPPASPVAPAQRPLPLQMGLFG